MKGWSPSRAALRGEALHHLERHCLKTVVVSAAGQAAAGLWQGGPGKMGAGREPPGGGGPGPGQVRSGKMSDGREPSAVDVSKPSQTRSKPRSQIYLGMSLGDARLLRRRSPAYRQHEPGPGSCTERVKACPILPLANGERECSQRRNP